MTRDRAKAKGEDARQDLGMLGNERIAAEEVATQEAKRNQNQERAEVCPKHHVVLIRRKFRAHLKYGEKYGRVIYTVYLFLHSTTETITDKREDQQPMADALLK